MAAIVRVVTLANANTETVRAFKDELDTLFGHGHRVLDYKVYSAVTEGSPSAAAAKAVGDNPQVIIAGGAAAVAAVIDGRIK